MRGLTRTLLLLTPMGVAALLRGGGTFGSFGELSAWSATGRPDRPVIAPAAAAPRRHEPGIVRTKKVLLALMAIGAAAYIGTGGTFSSFSAEVQNSGSSIASGTLTLNDQVNNGTVCLSANALSQNNVNVNCNNPLITLTNVAPGVFGGTNATAKVTITNSGSLDASTLYLYASYTNARLTGPPTMTGPNVTSLPISPLEGSIANNDNIAVSFGTNTQVFTANGATPAGAATIPVNAALPNSAYPANSTVTDTSSDNNLLGNTNCSDTQTGPAGGPGGPTKGIDLNFNPTTGNPLCSTLVMYVEETTGGNNYFCWYGRGSGASPQASGGLCTAPIAATLSGPVTGTQTQIGVSPLNGIVKSGDSITVTSTTGANSQICTASATAKFQATTIFLNSCAFGATNYLSGSTVVDTTALNGIGVGLNSDTVNTISNFDTGHNLANGKIPLYPVIGPGTTSSSFNSVLPALAAGAPRTFQIGLFLPALLGQPQNQLQGLATTFSLTWHLEQ